MDLTYLLISKEWFINQIKWFFLTLVVSYLFEKRHTVVVVIFDDVNHHHGEHRPEAKKDEETQERQENHNGPFWTSHVLSRSF